MRKKILSLLCLVLLITATFSTVVSAKENIFEDVSRDSWYYEYVLDVTEKGLMVGYSEKEFGPDDTLTRGQFAAILYRLEGEPTVVFKNSFKDVEDGRFYSAAVEWAYQEGIINGYPGNLFGPEDDITREQLVTIMYNYAGYKGMDTSEKSNLKEFTDVSDISNYALDAVKWAVHEEIIHGYGNGVLAPNDSVTRAMCAKIISVFSEYKFETEPEIPCKEGHNIGKWYVVKESTCKSEGQQRRDCTNCNYFETEVIIKKDHNYKTTVIKPSCTEKGYTKYTCSCGDNYIDKDSYTGPTSHNYNQGTCKDCGTKDPNYKEPEHEHVWVEHKEVIEHEAEGYYEEYLVKEAWTAMEPVYGLLYDDFCDTCGKDITDVYDEHFDESWNRYYAGEITIEEVCMSKTSICTGETGIIGYQEVNHPAEYETRWIETKPAWTEVITTYTCECGATKKE